MYPVYMHLVKSGFVSKYSDVANLVHSHHIVHALPEVYNVITNT